MNEEWVKETFEPEKRIKDIEGNKIHITKEEVYEAITSVAKNKASSADGITDTIFKKKTWHEIKTKRNKNKTNEVRTELEK